MRVNIHLGHQICWGRKGKGASETSDMLEKGGYRYRWDITFVGEWRVRVQMGHQIRWGREGKCTSGTSDNLGKGG